MSEPSDRMRKLKAMLEKQPDDTFVVYGVAMEYKKAGDAARALEFFDRVLTLDPGYLYAYHQKGLVHEGLGDADSARRCYREGVAAAEKKGDQHARDEIMAALEMLD